MKTLHLLFNLLLFVYFFKDVSTREIDLTTNLHKNLKGKRVQPKPVGKPNSPYFVRILKRRPNYVSSEDANDSEVEGIPRILSSRRFPILSKFQENVTEWQSESPPVTTNTSDQSSSELDVEASTLSSASTLLPLLGQILSTAAQEQESSVNGTEDSSASSAVEPSSIVEEVTARGLPQFYSSLTEGQEETETTVQESETTVATTLSTTTTTISTTTTTTEAPTTTTTTSRPANNIRLVQTNQIEVLTFPSTREPKLLTVPTTTVLPRTTVTWGLFQPRANAEQENNPLNVIFNAPGNFLVGMFKGIQQATEFVGDTINGFAKLLQPRRNN